VSRGVSLAACYSPKPAELCYILQGMRPLLVLALLAVSACGDDPLAPSEPVVPPAPTQASCVETIPGHDGFWLTVEGRAPVWIAPTGPTYKIVPCP
jgi:hypothetical protein